MFNKAPPARKGLFNALKSSKIDLAALVDFAVAHQGMVDQHIVDPGSVAIVGPGTIFRVLGEEETSATKTLCIPTRAMPIKATNGAANK